jgi:hypothetical protein
MAGVRLLRAAARPSSRPDLPEPSQAAPTPAIAAEPIIATSQPTSRINIS